MSPAKRNLLITGGIGVFLFLAFAGLKINPGRFWIKPGQTEEVMITNAQRALDIFVSKAGLESHVDLKVNSVRFTDKRLEVSVLEKRKTEFLDRKAATASIAAGSAERVAGKVPDGTTVHLVLVDESGNALDESTIVCPKY